MTAGNHCCGPAPTMCFKRGSTFTATVTYEPPEGAPPDLLGATITSQIRHRGTVVADLAVALAADGLSFVLSANDTTDWPVANLDWDIRIEQTGGAVIYSESIRLAVMYAVTQPATAPLAPARAVEEVAA